MRYVEAPQDCTCAGPELSVFLAGGITNCPDWQSEVVSLLAETDLILLNPRRKEWVMEPEIEEAQIVWEHHHLLRADSILFWFPKETVCPIALYELGAWTFRPKKLFIGCDPEYVRVRDVEIQTRLERPSQQVMRSLGELVSQILEWEKSRKANRFARDADQPEAKP